MINLFLFYILTLAKRQFLSIFYACACKKSKSNVVIIFEKKNQNYGMSFFPQSALIKFLANDIINSFDFIQIYFKTSAICWDCLNSDICEFFWRQLEKKNLL